MSLARAAHEVFRATLKLSRCAAQAAHWFNWDKFWPEVARVLSKDGTFAAWVRLMPYLCLAACSLTRLYERATPSSGSRATPLQRR